MDKLVVAALVVLPWSTLAYGQVAVDHEEFVGPFPSWANVKTDFGTIGDGSADDTEAFQKALDTFRGHFQRVVRAGRRLPHHPHLDDDQSAVPEPPWRGPSQDSHKWDGADEGTMLLCNGVCYAKFAHITWNGSGKSVTAIFHESENTKGVGTGNGTPTRCSSIWLLGSALASRISWMLRPASTAASFFVARKRVCVSRASTRWTGSSGILSSKTAQLGVTNDPGAGHFHVYRNIFRNSTVADIALRNAGYFGIRHNLSLGSRRFFEAQPTSGAGRCR